MNWFFLALVGPILWSIVNHLDKLLLERYFKHNGVGTLMIFSSIIGIIVLPVVYLIHPDILNIALSHKFIMLLVGIISAIALWLYFKALDNDEASVVVPFFQLIPVFGYVLGNIVLGEIITLKQTLAMFIVILGALIICFEIDEENKFKLRKKTAILMVFSAFLYSLDSVLFKFVAIKENFWTTTFWEYVGLSVVGVVLIVFHRNYRRDFILMVKHNHINIFSLNVFNEILTIIGNVATAYAYLLAPIALVLLVNSYQPIFVFAIGIIITLFFPKLSPEKIQLRHIIQKLIAFVIMGFGTYVLLTV